MAPHTPQRSSRAGGAVALLDRAHGQAQAGALLDRAHGQAQAGALLDRAHGQAQAGPPSTRIIVVAPVTSRMRSILASAARMSRSRASWVSMTTGTASLVAARPFWMTLAIEMALSPRIPATRESAPGLSCIITRR